MNNDYLKMAEAVIPDKKILSVVAAKRARQLALGGRPMVKCDAKNHIDVALLEIGKGLLGYTHPEFGTMGEPEPIPAEAPAKEAKPKAE
jgi:DNA-directed RNA polymerase omega subunit